jgi:hypothetical protein
MTELTMAKGSPTPSARISAGNSSDFTSQWIELNPLSTNSPASVPPTPKISMTGLRPIRSDSRPNSGWVTM